MIIGMDFGTTNSGMSVYDGHSVNLLPIDKSNSNPRVARTSLYVTNDQGVHIGREAVDHYFRQNVGRPVKLQKVWIGELEVYAEDLYYVTDAYAYVDVFSPGRLFLSMKSSLRDADYPGTVVGQFYYPLEDLIALYLTATKIRAEKILGQPLPQVVLGRPVRFSTDPQQDILAQSRLLQAAFRAGYEKVYLQPEPIAAAFSYETTISEEQHVLVFDFGGGTLDITVMRLGDPKRRAVLATNGIPVAGDRFDQKLVRAKLPHHFGEGSYYGPRHKALTVPQWIYDTFANWQTILELQSPDNKRILHEIAQTAQRRYQIEALISLVANNHGLRMFDTVEQAKRRLSQKRGAEILLEGPDFKVREFVTRTEFENIIRAEIRDIEEHLDATMEASGLSADQIDAVIPTGGSSQIPVFHEMLQRKFGAEKIRTVDTFSSVSAGLGVIAHGIEKGEIEAKGFTPADIPLREPAHSRPNVSPINLEIIQRRITADESQSSQKISGSQINLIGIDRQGNVLVDFVSGSLTETTDAISLPGHLPGSNLVHLAVAEPDEQLLFITSHYRFLLATARQLADLSKLDLGITNLHQLEPHETICTVTHWDRVSDQNKLLIVTSSGYTRTYPINILKPNVEAPIPMKFDQPLPGVPVLVKGVKGSGQLILVSRMGRAIRLQTNLVRTSGFQAMNCGLDDRVMHAAVVKEGDELLVITADGYGKRSLAKWIPLSAKANVKGKSLVARRSDIVTIVPAPAVPVKRLVTSSQIAAISCDKLPLQENTKTQSLLKLRPDESVQAWLQI